MDLISWKSPQTTFNFIEGGSEIRREKSKWEDFRFK